MGINHKQLVEHFRKDPAAADRGLKEAFKAKQIRADEFNLTELFSECFGYGELVACRSDRKRLINKDVFEAAGAVTTNAFTNINGQIVYNALMESYEAPEYVFKALIPEINTVFLAGEKVAGIKGLGDETQQVPENEPYPLVGTSEDYIETPPLVKRGFIVPVSREAVLADRTGLLLDRCRQVGKWMGYNDELRAIDCIVDRNGGAVSAKLGGHRYHFRGDSIATYGDSSGTHNWDNLQATNGLVDYSDIENAELLLAAMADPGTGIVTGAYRGAASQLIVCTANLHTARQVTSAEWIRVAAGGYATSGNLPSRQSPNTLQPYEIVSSPIFDTRCNLTTDWFLGNIGKAFRKMVAWKNEVVTAASGSHEEFNRDVVFQVKGSQMDAYTTFDPRYMIKSTA